MKPDRASLVVNEIFYSLQGESTRAGLACVMIRLSGCNLRCTWCDTTYACDDGREMTLDEIMTDVSGFDCRLVEITGGEPLLQAHTPQLIDRLLASGLTVLLETNGTFDISPVNRECVIIMDIKCPSSGESSRHDQANCSRLRPHDQVKFVIADEDDYFFARDTAAGLTLLPPEQILFSPVWGVMPPAQLAAWILRDRLSNRMQLQLHKIIWPGERGR